MSWNQDHLAPVETLLFRSALAKVGNFVCRSDDPCFPVSESLDNDVFVMPKMPVWVRRDEGEYRFVEPGAILMHRAGQTLERRRTTEDGERTYWFGVRPDVFVHALQRYGLPTHEMGGALIVDPKFRYRMAAFLTHLQHGALSQMAVEEAVIGFLDDICRKRASRLRSSFKAPRRTVLRQRRLVDNAREFLDAHSSENVGLDIVANATGTSLFHLCRVFRQQTGLTMHAYRIRQRLWQVTDRLVAGDAKSLTDLALEEGFSSHSHLSRVFQRQMGVSPSVLRSTCSRAFR